MIMVRTRMSMWLVIMVFLMISGDYDDERLY